VRRTNPIEEIELSGRRKSRDEIRRGAWTWGVVHLCHRRPRPREETPVRERPPGARPVLGHGSRLLEKDIRIAVKAHMNIILNRRADEQEIWGNK
jgi:hypothetical protein